MNILFLTRKHVYPNTAIVNAAGHDMAHLKAQGHSVLHYNIADPEGCAFGIKFDLTVIEGAAWFPIEQIKAVKKFSKHVIVRVHAAPEFLHFEHPGKCTSQWLSMAKDAGAQLAFVSEALARVFKSRWLSIVYPRFSASCIPPIARRVLNVGCFGAIRPQKNTLAQFLAAMELASSWQSKLRFHINGARVEGSGGPEMLAEMRRIAVDFKVSIVDHAWEDHTQFRTSTIPQMSVGMFASQAESFCLTAADFVAMGVPIVASCHIPWAKCRSNTDLESLQGGLGRALSDRKGNVEDNQFGLREISERAVRSWADLEKSCR